MHDIYSRGYHNTELLALCRALLPGDTSLADEVGLAIARPDDYLVAFEERLADRGISPFDERLFNLPLIALLDGLRERGQLVEIDWREYPAEVVSGIDRLLNAQMDIGDRWVWVDLEKWTNTSTDAFLKAIAERLQMQGLTRACFRTMSDSYPLIVVGSGRFPILEALAQQTGYGELVPCLEGNDF